MTQTTTNAAGEKKPEGDALFLSRIAHELRALKETRKDINDQIKAAMDAVEGRGFSKKAMAEALRLLDMEEDERQTHEKSRRAITQALGCAVQIDLFPDQQRH